VCGVLYPAFGEPRSRGAVFVATGAAGGYQVQDLRPGLPDMPPHEIYGQLRENDNDPRKVLQRLPLVFISKEIAGECHNAFVRSPLSPD